ncbi:MAG: hypothetical protein ACLFQK_07705 [Fibrobacterota bacterium]
MDKENQTDTAVQPGVNFEKAVKHKENTERSLMEDTLYLSGRNTLRKKSPFLLLVITAFVLGVGIYLAFFFDKRPLPGFLRNILGS